MILKPATEIRFFRQIILSNQHHNIIITFIKYSVCDLITVRELRSSDTRQIR